MSNFLKCSSSIICNKQKFSTLIWLNLVIIILRPAIVVCWKKSVFLKNTGEINIEYQEFYTVDFAGVFKFSCHFKEMHIIHNRYTLCY